MINKVKEIIIFGGGTSGWLAATYMVNKLNFPVKITVIESKIMGPLGVGEGTQPGTARFLYDAGIMPKTWMKPSSASFKYGVEFDGWTDEKYFVDNDFVENTIIGPEIRTVDYFIDKPAREFFKNLPAYTLAKANVSPKLAGLDNNYALPGIREYGAVHFVALDIVEALHDIIKDKITYFDTKIVEINKDENGISSLVDEEGRTHTADLYIDCTGFKAALIEETLGVNFNSIEHMLPCNRAVAIPKAYTNPQEECKPFTSSTAMSAGWRWTIPNFKRIGNGYVYSDKFITPEEAEAELRHAIGEFDAPANHLKMKCGSHEVTAYKNVVAVGLSAGFVEPLEATGITFTTKITEILTNLLNFHNGVWNDVSRAKLNDSYLQMTGEIIVFVWAHYHFSTKKDTPFWKAIHYQKEIPPAFKKILDHFLPTPHNGMFLTPTSSFHIGHWFSVLHSANLYDDLRVSMDPETKKYAEYFIKNQQDRVKNAIEAFPNHYEYLKQWYAGDDTSF
jgi:Tryptophan halogenase